MLEKTSTLPAIVAFEDKTSVSKEMLLEITSDISAYIFSEKIHNVAAKPEY